MFLKLTAIALLGITTPVWADDPTPVPLTRPGLKQLLEDSKKVEPRLKAAASANNGQAAAGVRNLLPPELKGGYFMQDGRPAGNGLRNPNAPARPQERANTPRMEPDPNMTLDNAFKVELFWIVSRSNNCVYCTGHQEVKLRAAGLTEDRIAGLDGDWSEYTHAERAAFALTRKLTVAPQSITDADIEGLRKHYTNPQILEIITTVAGFNAMNRWTGSLRLTQQEHHVFLTPTSPKFEAIISRVAPVPAGSTGAKCAPVAAERPALEPRATVETKLAECRERASRFPMVDESTARGLLAADAFPADKPLPNWARLLLNFPKAGPARIAGLRASETKGNLSPKLKAELAWVSARADRAWYALGYARDRLRELGLDDNAIFAIDQATGPAFTPAEQAAFAFARKLTVDPALIDDDDFDSLRKASFTDAQIAELIHHVNNDVFINLVTEAASLPLEGGPTGSASRR
jgi:alkylhydroperoxidase family enzyme